MFRAPTRALASIETAAALIAAAPFRHMAGVVELPAFDPTAPAAIVPQLGPHGIILSTQLPFPGKAREPPAMIHALYIGFRFDLFSMFGALSGPGAPIPAAAARLFVAPFGRMSRIFKLAAFETCPPATIIDRPVPHSRKTSLHADGRFILMGQGLDTASPPRKALGGDVRPNEIFVLSPCHAARPLNGTAPTIVLTM